MGVRIIEGRGDYECCLYDSVTMVAFGPVFRDSEQAEDFLATLTRDARAYTIDQLMEKWVEFILRTQRDRNHSDVET
jgi:hypothetical protein